MGNRTNKYNAQVTFYDPKTGGTLNQRLSDSDIKFDSKWELEVYKTLCKVWEPERILLQHQVLIHYPLYRFEKLVWRCDFALLNEANDVEYLVDAKGLILPEFVLKMRLFATTKPHDYLNVVLVVKDSSKYKRCPLRAHIVSLDTLVHRLTYNW